MLSLLLALISRPHHKVLLSFLVYFSVEFLNVKTYNAKTTKGTFLYNNMYYRARFSIECRTCKSKTKAIIMITMANHNKRKQQNRENADQVVIGFDFASDW